RPEVRSMRLPRFIVKRLQDLSDCTAHRVARRGRPRAGYNPAMPSVWLNGDFFDEAAASIPVRDTGLLHAAGVFTTMRADGGRVFRLSQHLRRLRDSCEVLSIPLEQSDATLTSAVHDLLKRDSLSEARLRLTVTR